MPSDLVRTSTRLVQTVLLSLFTLIHTDAGAADAGRLRYLSLTTENDNYAPERQDRHYTNGTRVALGLAGKESPWYRWLSRFSGLNTTIRNYEIAIGQNIYTPENFTAQAPQTDDRPFGGWLYSELTQVSRSPGKEEAVAINLGVVGPAALGKQAQKFIHDLVGDPEPRGWDNQLRNEPALLLRYRHSRFTSLLRTENIEVDLVSRFGASAGNVVTEAGAGAVFRLGNKLSEHDIPMRLQPGLSGSSAYIPARQNRFDWMLSAEIQGRGVLQNIFLDGNLFSDSLSVDRRPFVWDAGVGLNLGFGQLTRPVFFSFFLTWRGKEFNGQRGVDNFASATIGVGF